MVYSGIHPDVRYIHFFIKFQNFIILIFIVPNFVFSSFDAIVFGFFRILRRSIFVTISPFNTKNDSSFTLTSAFLIAPPVPKGVFSIEKIISQPKFFFF